MTLISDFDYHLPKEVIAQEPISPRENAKLMVLDKTTGEIEHKFISDLINFFRRGDVVVINNTKVFKARLIGNINDGKTTRLCELFLIRPIDNHIWSALGKPGKKFKPGLEFVISDDFSGKIIKNQSDGTIEIYFKYSPQKIMTLSDKFGHVPAPPYIKKEPNQKDYQTSYAKILGSVAAPTAGFHLTQNIRSTLSNMGVEILEITLHVGLGTFLPVKSLTLEDHPMHSEWVNVTASVVEIINTAKKQNRRIIAVGTTTVRTLEGVAVLNNGLLKKYAGDIDLFIKPGFKFQIVDAMLTNFHLPKSTLIVLASAFAGRENIMRAYQVAIKNNYRFYSFGDAMLII